MADFRVDVSDLLHAIGAEKRLSITGQIPFIEKGGERISFKSPISMDLRLTNIGGQIRAKGKLEADIQLSCGRCLKEYQEHIATDVEEIYRKPGEFQREDMRGFEDEQVYLILKESIDLQPMAEAACILAVPFKPLCETECKGLCPVCGEDLNVKPHEHEKEIDERLSPLKKLIEGA
jgi:uncharacterized protein